MTNFNEMGKAELRAACKAAGIAYGKLNNDGMRAALEAAAKPVDLETLGQFGLGDNEDNAACPHCGINHRQNGWQYDSPEYKCDTNEFACLGCGGEWGPKVVRVKAEDRHTGKGLKIEKVRESRNGVTRPSAGGKCRAVWDALDAYRAEEKEIPTIDIVRAIAQDEGWNPSNAAIEFYQWRKFNGINGRSK